MKKRFSTFGLLNFFIVLVLLFRQIYYMNLISSFVISNEIESGILLLLSIIVLIGLTAFFVYYLPALLVIKVTLNLELRSYFLMWKESMELLRTILFKFRIEYLKNYRL